MTAIKIRPMMIKKFSVSKHLISTSSQIDPLQYPAAQQDAAMSGGFKGFLSLLGQFVSVGGDFV